MLNELKDKLKVLARALHDIKGYLNIEKRLEIIKDVEHEISKSDFWTDSKRAEKLIGELKAAKSISEPYLNLAKQRYEMEELLSIVEEKDTDTINELTTELNQIEKNIYSLESKSLLSKPEDRYNVILSVNSGAGGTESCDWASMLFRMYARWADNKGFGVSVVDHLQGEEAGIKNITAIIKGEFAYGYLKAEIGVHRLVRISPFDSNKRRHTSFASVDVIPEIDDDIDIKINESEIRIDTYRSSGAGGQHVNVTDSAVRITHLPSGIVTQCQNERSQYKNKTVALKVLKAKLYELEKAKKMKEVEKHNSAKQEIAWGSQIRSYVMHPYSMVKDHRTDYETSNTNAVMDGDIDGFIDAYLRMKASDSK